MMEEYAPSRARRMADGEAVPSWSVRKGQGVGGTWREAMMGALVGRQGVIWKGISGWGWW